MGGSRQLSTLSWRNLLVLPPAIMEVLRLYPENTIVWMHMGLSRELVDMDALQHTSTMAALFGPLAQSAHNGYLQAS